MRALQLLGLLCLFFLGYGAAYRHDHNEAKEWGYNRGKCFADVVDKMPPGYTQEKQEEWICMVCDIDMQQCSKTLRYWP